MAPVLARITPRDPNEPHRAASSLELLFDLCFVVAIAQAASGLHHQIGGGHLLDGVVGYLTVFFAIWWAWMNYTWFASSYDTDDTAWRLLTFVQIGGVLVLAAGVPDALEAANFTAVTIGYAVMRIGLVTQWLRTARDHLERRRTALRCATGVTIVQIGWIARLWLPEELGMASFLALVACEFAVPFWAERAGMTPWHPHHIAERFGLLTLIVLGESVLSATLAVQASYADGGVSWQLLTIAFGGLALLFAMWWMYFQVPFGDALHHHRQRAFLWGYVHYAVFASIAAIGAGVAVLIDAGSGGHAAYGDATLMLTVALPLAVFVLTVGVLQNYVCESGLPIWWFLLAAGTILSIAPLAVDGHVELVVVGLVLPLVAMVVATSQHLARVRTHASR